jgi:P-type Cu+ transporter
MLTGDVAGVAGAIGRELEIDDIQAKALPQNKLAYIAKLQAQGVALGFVGDGINDAPALAAADVGLALGTGTDIAMDAAQIILVSRDLRAVVNGVKISRLTMRNIRQNLAWAFGYNVVLIPVAAGVLVPFGGPQLSPILAAGAMALSSIFVLINAARLRRIPSVNMDVLS